MIGLLPAAGKAERIHGLPKFLLPIPEGETLIHRHIFLMREAGCAPIVIGANSDNKQLIVDHTDYTLVYVAKHHDTMAQTVLSFYETWLHPSGRAGEERICFGMPDVYFSDASAYQQVAAVEADIVVGCFRIPPNEQHKHDLVRIEHGRVVEVLNKPAPHSSLQCTWGILLWKPVYWQYLQPDDPHVGHGLPRAIADGLDVRPVVIEGGYWNIGTTDDYFNCIRALNTPEKAEA